jgi:iron-sulfur cluster repair protein YtfE (RIC family)
LMAESWELFLEEHRHLRTGVHRIRQVAASVGKGSGASLRSGLDEVYGFLSHQLLPHIAVEERILYPVIARTEGLQETATAMRRDHAQVAAFVRELAEVRDELARFELLPETAEDLRRLLYGLYAVLLLHMGDEEDVCLPALDRELTEERIRVLMEGLELFEMAEQAGE